VVRDSLREFGQVEALVTTPEGRVIGGNCRLSELRALGAKEISVMEVDLEGIDQTRLALVLNRSAELADWDEDVLKALSQDIDMEALGWDEEDLKGIIDEPEEATIEREPPEDLTEGGLRLLQGSFQERIKEIPDHSVDLVLTDPPYGTTSCEWDTIIPFDLMWQELKRVLRTPQSPIVLFSAPPFTLDLCQSNRKDYRYDWYWLKNSSTGHLLAKRQPMRVIEIISVFAQDEPKYYPQGLQRLDKRRKYYKTKDSIYGAPKEKLGGNYDGYPNHLLQFDKVYSTESLHPSQKPVDLLEYLIKTYTLEGATVLDYAMGSGSTGVAAVNTGRSFIGIELDPDHFNLSKKRIEEAQE
jgi:site-specific DNA-methyltransferase (adenine-specific)